MLSHGNLDNNSRNLYALWGWQKDDVLIHALPIFHIHGLFVALHSVFIGGGSTMLFLSRFDAKQLIQLIPQATVLMGVPTFYTRLLQDEALNTALCLNMRLFVSGSAPLLLKRPLKSSLSVAAIKSLNAMACLKPAFLHQTH